MRFFIPILLCIVIGFASCKKAVNTSPDFVGEWVGTNSTCNLSITIPAEGKGRYYKVCDTIYVESNGIPFLKSKEQVLKIGKREFQISGADVDGSASYKPYEDNDSLRITLDGVMFTKVD
jgi:hypothetical protein